ncbi:MAG: hydrogenase-1 expression HyaE [Rhodobiaceae bacterium]|nr:hydrogenase-1 expression HyaE [Rhodobiaceae bacterium]
MFTISAIDHRAHGYGVVGEEILDAISHAANEHVVLFVPAMPNGSARAMMSPSSCRSWNKVFDVTRWFPPFVSRESERGLQRRYRFNAFPALVFLRDGEYLGTIQRVPIRLGRLPARDPEILLREPSEPPPFRLPDGCARRRGQQVSH